ncbi:putative c2h2 transcription factor protein [Golovinomyces cichoracearum]|uniref:Putative c2h2 transcription factor protein n=1 Tax=Golovinomyces cichoracearum TaxID=62708 RepID=A0A420HT95_9PEZI|nr:putative c2h2 transcription factor protein [Golovinomyces cichoracearum]
MLASMSNHCDQFYECSPQIISPLYTSSGSGSGTTSNISKQQNFHAQGPQFSTSRWPIQSPYLSSAGSTIYTLTEEQPSLDYFSSQQFLSSSSAALPMHSGHTPHFYPCRLEQGQDIPRTVTNTHHRESSLSSLGSTGPESPYTTNLANPLIVDDIFEFNDISSFSTQKFFAPAPAHEVLLVPQFSSNQQGSSNLSLDMLSIPEMSYQERPQIPTSLGHHSPSISPLSEQNDQQNKQQTTEETQSSNFWMNGDVLPCDQAYGNISKIGEVITEVYEDGHFNPNLQISADSSPSTSIITAAQPSHNNIFEQRLQDAKNQHICANAQTPLILSNRECTPFSHGSPLAASNSFNTNSPSMRFGTALHLREQQKAESDARVLREQLRKESNSKSTPTTISPKDVDMVYYEEREDSLAAFFPSQQKTTNVMPSYQLKQEPTKSDENMSQQNYGSVAATRRDSSSTYSSSQPTSNQNTNFNFVMPVVNENFQRLPQQYSFLPSQTQQQTNMILNSTSCFQTSQPSIDLRRGDYESESRNVEIKKPARVNADTGTYTCTYHGCTLRFDTPARLQRHKREGHRSSSAAAVASTVNGIGGNGITSSAFRNSQAGPHRCDRINPSTGKPCNTLFSRPYDLTRHEDTIHNTQKQKVYCPLCEDEKSFSRNDALTRHMRVVHPEYVDTTSRRRRGISG